MKIKTVLIISILILVLFCGCIGQPEQKTITISQESITSGLTISGCWMYQQIDTKREGMTYISYIELNLAVPIYTTENMPALRDIRLYVDVATTGETVRIYDQISHSVPLLKTSSQWIKFTIDKAIPNNVVVVKIAIMSGDQITWMWGANNPYPFGMPGGIGINVDESGDFAFRVVGTS